MAGRPREADADVHLRAAVAVDRAGDDRHRFKFVRIELVRDLLDALRERELSHPTQCAADLIEVVAAILGAERAQAMLS